MFTGDICYRYPRCEAGRPITGADLGAADRTEIACTADAFPLGYTDRGRAG